MRGTQDVAWEEISLETQLLTSTENAGVTVTPRLWKAWGYRAVTWVTAARSVTALVSWEDWICIYTGRGSLKQACCFTQNPVCALENICKISPSCFPACMKISPTRLWTHHENSPMLRWSQLRWLRFQYLTSSLAYPLTICKQILPRSKLTNISMKLFISISPAFLQ